MFEDQIIKPAAPKRRLVQLEFRQGPIKPPSQPQLSNKAPISTKSSVQKQPILHLDQPRKLPSASDLAKLGRPNEANRKSIPTRNHQLPKLADKSKNRTSAKASPFSTKGVRKLHFAAVGIATFVILGGAALVGVLTQSPGGTNRQYDESQAEVNSAKVVADNVPPEESAVDAAMLSSHKVSPDKPKRLTIAKLGIDARIQAVGMNSKNDLRGPSNIYDVGWYEKSASLGGSGATLLGGYVHGPSKTAAFYNLRKLAKDDLIQIERGDGKIFKYKITGTKTYDAPRTDMQAALTPVTPSKSALNLITITENTDQNIIRYNERVIVSAALVE